MLAVAKIAGKQFIAEVGKKLKISSKIDAKDKKVKFTEILLLADDKTFLVGKPFVVGASIDTEIVEEKKGEKILVVKHHAKKRYRRVKGHRQDETTILIKKINEKQ